MKKTLGIEHQRQRAIELALEHIGSGGTPYTAATLAGVKYKSLWRWLKQVGENGGDIAAVATGKRIGRPPVALLTEEEVLRVQARVKGDVSEVMALRLACMAGEVRGEVASVVMSLRRKHDIPGALRRQIKVAEAVQAYHHSPKNFRLKHISTPRRNVTIQDGIETPDLPGDSFVFDDMTVNFAWWTPWPLADCETSRRYGVKVTRGQLLTCMDVGCFKFLHFALIARAGESYQANDIWAEYGRIFRTIGMPRKDIVHEGGHWTAHHIHGQKVTMVGADEELRVGGLQRLGVAATRSWSPKTKPIEGRFNFLQTLMSELPGNLGREREGTKEWKIYNKCSAGTLDPREYLPSQTQLADKIQQIMATANREPLDGRLKGIPDELWDAAISARPLAQPPADMGWIFARDARLLTIPAKGPLKCRFQKTNGEQELYFDHTALLFIPIPKLRVMAHFDPLETEGEAVLISADARSFNLPPFEGNPARTVRTGDVLCVAQRVHASARVTDAPDGNLGRTRAKVAAVRTESRRIDSNKSRATKMAEAYDGFGNAARLETGGDASPAEAGPLTLPPRPTRQILPATSSRAMPADPAAEIARLTAQLLAAD
jgi:hypothetical protein